MARKSNGTASILAHVGSVLMDNRHGLIVATDVRAPSYDAEPEAAVERLTTLEPRAGRRTRGADKSYDRPAFVDGVRACHTTPHVAETFGVRVRPTGVSDRPPGDRMPMGNAVRTAKRRGGGRRAGRCAPAGPRGVGDRAVRSPDTRPTPIEIPILREFRVAYS